MASRPRGARATPRDDAAPARSLTHWAVVGLLLGHPAHGFALAAELSPAAPLGRIWTVPRPLVYRALAGLELAGLVRRAGVEAAQLGPQRTVYEVTPAGEEALRHWLEQPVAHLRDLRSELLLKLYLHDRLGADPRRLLEAQLRRVEELVSAIDLQRRQSGGFDAVLVEWRFSTAAAAAGFLARRLAAPPAG